MIGLLCLALLLTSCKRLRGAAPTARPTLTPTPRSTPLPPLPTQIPLGSADNPLHMEIVAPQGSPRASSSAVGDLEQALLDEMQMTVSIDLVANDAEALSALCGSPDGTISVAWLSGLGYAAAYAQDCGMAALQVQRGERSSGSTGDESVIVVNSRLDISAIGDLQGHSFCRLGYSDLYSWLVPSLMMGAGGVQSADALKSVQDYEDSAALVDAVASGDCDAAGIAASQYDDLVGADVRSKVRKLQQSATIPYMVLVVPSELPLGQQEQLSDALVAIGNGTRADTLKPLLNQDQLVAVTDNDLGSLRAFVNRAGIDLAQAGE